MENIRIKLSLAWLTLIAVVGGFFLLNGLMVFESMPLWVNQVSEIVVAVAIGIGVVAIIVALVVLTMVSMFTVAGWGD